MFCRFYCLPENVTAGVPTSGYFDCPAGYYCANGTGLDWQPCPKGTYSTKTNLYMVRQVVSNGRFQLYCTIFYRILLLCKINLITVILF